MIQWIKGSVKLTDMPGVISINARHLHVLRVPRRYDGDVIIVGERSSDDIGRATITPGVGAHEPVVQPLFRGAHVGDGLDAAAEVVVEDPVPVVGPQQDHRQPARRRHLGRVVRDHVVPRVVPLACARVALQDRVHDPVLLVLVEYRCLQGPT